MKRYYALILAFGLAPSSYAANVTSVWTTAQTDAMTTIVSNNAANWSASRTTVVNGSANWDIGYSQRFAWDGGTSFLVPATARASLQLDTYYQPLSAELTALTNGSAVQAVDIDTLAELNAIVTNATLIQVTDINTLAGLNTIVADATLGTAADFIADATDTVDETHINWGEGALQVSAEDIPLDDAEGLFTATDADGAMTELNKVATALLSANYVLGTDDPREAYGGVMYPYQEITITLPPVIDGMSFTVVNTSTNTVTVDPSGSEIILLDTTELDGGDKVISQGTIGEVVTFVYWKSGYWAAMSDGWTDGGP